MPTKGSGEGSFWQRRTARALAYLAGVAAVFAIVGGSLWWRAHVIDGVWSYSGWRGRPFNAAEWKAARSWERDNLRGRMTRALLRERRLAGLSRAEVLALLGEPDGSDGRLGEDLASVTPEEAARARSLQWFIGMWSGFGLGYDTLSVRFGPAGRVAGAHINR